MEGFGSRRRRHHGRPEGPLLGYAWSATGGLVTLDGIVAIEAAAADPALRLWVDLEDASEETLARIGGALGIHELVLEDMAHRGQRAKVEHTDGTMHLVVYALTYASGVHAHEVDIVVSARFLVSSHPPGWRPAETIDLARRGIGHYLSEGTDFLLYAIIDPIVDGYFPLMDHLSDEIDSLEDQVVAQPSKPVLERLFRIRRELLRVRHTVSPEREILNQLTNRENPLIDPARILYFRDVYDHLIRVTDELDTHRELVSGALEAYLSTVNNGLSDVMKRLTAVTAVLAGVGAAAGIFGMSEAGSALMFRQEPGFWLVASLVALVGVSVFLYFRHIDWI